MTFVTERQGAVHEDFGRLRAHLDQLRARKPLQGCSRGLEPDEITPEDAGIDLAERRQALAAAMIAQFRFFEALVGATQAECRKMRKVHALAKLHLNNPPMERLLAR